ncbi:MAG: general secretion pathway protein GspK [Nitrospirae bacterium]|nr:general secretion pathway protein GspK [Nitrospirota bacterium]
MSNKKGYVLVIVLLILAVTTAAVVQFAGTVYGYVNTANNFNESERMSLLLKSAYLLAAERALALSSQFSFSSQREIALEEKIEDTTVGLLLRDNNSRFNVNSLVFRNGLMNENGYNIFKRLLRELRIDEAYADRLVDFIDPDKIPRVPDGESNAKNYFLFSLSELGYIFPEDVLKTALPYLTVFGDGTINVNTADVPLLKALHRDMTTALAERLREVREGKPFERMADLLKVPGMERIGIDMSDAIKVKSNSFSAAIKAERNDFAETAEAGFDLNGGRAVLKYWREQ